MTKGSLRTELEIVSVTKLLLDLGQTHEILFGTKQDNRCLAVQIIISGSQTRALRSAKRLSEDLRHVKWIMLTNRW